MFLDGSKMEVIKVPCVIVWEDERSRRDVCGKEKERRGWFRGRDV